MYISLDKINKEKVSELVKYTIMITFINHHAGSVSI